MRETLQNILRIYPEFRSKMPFNSANEVNHLFTSLRAEVSELGFVKTNPNLIVKSSYGKGNWAAVPWLAILDTRETSSTQNGTYVVILFSEDGQHCQFKLAQGVTDVKATYKRNAPDELKKRADKIREEIANENIKDLLPTEETLNLGKGNLARLYETSTILSKQYAVNDIAEDSELISVIENLVASYQLYITNLINNQNSSQEEETSERVWAISAGQNGNQWEDFLQRGEIAIGWDDLGDLDNFTDQTQILNALTTDNDKHPTNDALCCHQFAKEISINDIVVAKIGRKKILGMGRVTSEYYWDESRDSFRSRRKVNWLRTDSSEFPGTGTTVKTLTEITQYPTFINLVNDYLGIDTPDSEVEEEEQFDEYSVASIQQDGSFLPEARILSIINRLRVKKNIILQGPPGTGKTWLAKRLAFALIGQKNTDRIKVVQFHANTTYEDFIRGYRPTTDGKLALTDGAFMEAIEDARNSSQPYVVVVEEVNRGNPAQIFGEMLTLIEADKRSPQNALELIYKRRNGEKVYIPPNLYLIGTMNIADRSLALVDLALRRRFAFIDLEPNFNQQWRDWLENSCDFSKEFIAQVEAKMTSINDVISEDHRLGNQFKIGHSYVTPPIDSDISNPMEWFKDVIHTELSPLIHEYWFDDVEKAQKVVKDLERGI